MWGVEEEGGIPSSFDYRGGGSSLDDLGCDRQDDARFDASQYEFFGKHIVDEVELGGLEDDESGAANHEDGHISCIGDREEVEDLLSFSDADDLTNTFSKLNIVSGAQNSRVIGDRGYVSRESSLSDWNWLEQQTLSEAEINQGYQCRSTSDPSVPGHLESNAIYRTSSYPLKQSPQHEMVPVVPDPRSLCRTSSYPQQLSPQNSSEPILIPKQPFISYPPSGGHSHPSPNFSPHARSPPFSAGIQSSFSPRNFPSFPGSQLHVPGSPRGMRFGANVLPFSPPGSSIPCRPQGLLMNQANPFFGGHPPQPRQSLTHTDGGRPSALYLQQHQQQMIPHRAQQSSRVQRFQPHHMYPPEMNKLDPFVGMADTRDYQNKLLQMSGQTMRVGQHFADAGNHRGGCGWPLYRLNSKYMSAGEIDGILRMQHAATHSSDPYLEDYYHQACLAKRSAGSGLKHHFSPQSIKDLPSRERSNSDQHAYLQVDALGRLAFSSIRRPRPLLEVDPPSAESDCFQDQKSVLKPLEQEPLLAARITIEDGLSLLLDIDDIDRLLEFGHFQDSGFELRSRKQVLLEGLASSLQLVDPLDPGKGGHSNDLVFLRIISLPKGRKLLSRYLNLILPGSDLARVACMAVFRNLRFLFGALPLDGAAVDTTSNLVLSVSSSTRNMDLNALSACLAAVVCSSEQPPLRPLGSVAGDGASVLVMAVLERATFLLMDPQALSQYNVSNRALWQASFDAFFNLLMRYCLSRYDSVMQMVVTQTPNSVITGPEASGLMGKDIPVDLLRASLPHTNEEQRKVLLDFAQRSVPVAALSAHGGSNGQVTTQSVRS